MNIIQAQNYIFWHDLAVSHYPLNGFELIGLQSQGASSLMALSNFTSEIASKKGKIKKVYHQVFESNLRLGVDN